MFFPTRHDSNEGRRWPIITIAIVLINFAVFLGTHWQMEEESPEKAIAGAHLIMLAAMHPELTVPPSAQDFVETVKRDKPDLWKQAQSPFRDIEDAWDARIRLMTDQTKLQEEMDSLAEQYASFKQSSIPEQYGFIPAHPSLLSYITANFLHSGWLHLLGNMWFLWLAGAVLEDTWGRVAYPIFYLLGGAAAMQFYAWLTSDTLTPAIGASGAVSALMGAFLIRFPTTKINVVALLGFRLYHFKAAAVWLLPFWLLREVFSGVFGELSGVAHWAHVGGFVFGAVFALGMKYSGLEHEVSKAIDKKVTWTADEGFLKATEQMEQGKLDEALTTLNAYIASKPNSVEACTLLPQILWRKNDVAGYRNAVARLCQLHIQNNDIDAALQDYQEFTNSGGALPAPVWLELCRALEAQNHLDQAVSEYENLANTYPADRQSVLALLAAGRLSLKRLSRPSDALRFYQAAAASPAPHLDWETNIQNGIRDARNALTAVQPV